MSSDWLNSLPYLYLTTLPDLPLSTLSRNYPTPYVEETSLSGDQDSVSFMVVRYPSVLWGIMITLHVITEVLVVQVCPSLFYNNSK